MKRFTKILTLLFLMLSVWQNANAQEASKISGQVKESNGKGLPFANISLVEDATSKLITGTVTDSEGNFSFLTTRTGMAKLIISSIGFQTFTTEAFEMKEGVNKNFGALEVKENVASLKEVTVKSTRPEVIVEADKTVVNVAGTVLAEGNNALDVIGRSPGVYVDSEGIINLNGRSGVMVLIDDKQTYMSAADLANFLRSMPADNIKSIEVITTPGAKFDAEGAAGVINIKLKRNNIDGLYGSVNTGGRFNGLYAPFGGTSLSVKKGKWASSGNLNYSEFAFDNVLDLYRNFHLPEGTSLFDQNSLLRMRFKTLFFNGNTNYQFHKNHSVGMGVQASGHEFLQSGTSNTNFNIPGSQDKNYLNSITGNVNGNQRLYLTLNYSGTLDSIGSKLTADVDLAIMNAAGDGLLTNSRWVNQDPDRSLDYMNTLTDMDFYIFTAKTDYTRPLGKGKSFEAGLKGSWILSDNDLEIRTRVPETEFVRDQNSNAFIYHENVLAAYATYKSPLSKSLNFQGGLRAEYSDILGNSVTLNQRNPQKYLNLFPTFFLQHKVNKNYQINYSANRRITRPNYRLLNPFINFIDPLTSERGNPQLQPQFAYNVEMNHVIMGAFQLSTGYSRITNLFQQIFEQEEESRETTTYTSNFDNAEQFNFRAILPYQFKKVYNMSNMIQVNHNKFRSLLDNQMLDVQQTSYTLRSQHNIMLPKGFKLELIGMYIGPQLFGQGLMNSFGWVDAGVTKSMMKDKLTLTVNGGDLFATQRYNARIQFANIDAGFTQYRNTQSVRFTARYNFSKGEKFRVNTRTGSAEERNRLGE
jgi:hypothetical protein